MRLPSPARRTPVNELLLRRYNLLVSTMNKDGSLVHRQTYVCYEYFVLGWGSFMLTGWPSSFMNEAKRLLEKYPNGIDDFEDTGPPDPRL